MDGYNEWVPEVAERDFLEREAVMQEIALQDGGYDEWLANLDAEAKILLMEEALTAEAVA